MIANEKLLQTLLKLVYILTVINLVIQPLPGSSIFTFNCPISLYLVMRKIGLDRQMKLWDPINFFFIFFLLSLTLTKIRKFFL